MDKKRKKPNYKLRRTVAKIILVLIILIPILLINKDKILHAPIYWEYRDYSKLVDSFFDSNYTTEETKAILNKLQKKKIIKNISSDMVIELHKKGYSNNTINYVIVNLNKTEITKMLNKKYNRDFEEYVTLDLFDYKKYDRYLEYQNKNPNISLDDVVTRIELNVDLEPYEDVEEEKNPSSLTALVNKHRYIGKNYVPDDLVEMEDDYANNSYSVETVRKETYEQFKKMCDDARNAGINFYAESGYRTYDYQEEIYRNYVYNYGQEEADLYAAKAGYSEHQLGTTLDIANTWTIEEGDDEYKWIDKNGYKYGFIFRYKSSKENITGYKAEGWHIRYVGVEAATIIHKKNITFDEYWIRYVKNKK